MSIENKPLSERDQPQIFKKSYNEVNATLGVDGFIVAQVGNQVVLTNPTSSSDMFSFYETQSGSQVLLYSITITYTDTTKATLSSVQRTA